LNKTDPDATSEKKTEAGFDRSYQYHPDLENGQKANILKSNDQKCLRYSSGA
jgi:hypothetical protein